MSASREKKKRQEFLANGGVDAKAIREAEEKAATKKANTFYAILGVAFVVIAIALLVYNSGIIERNQTALTVDGQDYTVAEVSYYYGNAYQNFLNSDNGYFATMLGMLDTSLPLDSQGAWGGEEQTWAEYFQEETVNSLKFVQAVRNNADSEGVTLDDADMEIYNSTIESVKAQAKENGYSYKNYLTAVYGAAMTPAIYEECLKNDMLVSKYASDYSETITFTEDEVEAYYQENKTNYDVVDAEYLYISGSPKTGTDADGNAIEATDEERAEAMEDAKAIAEEILAAYEAGGDLEALAAEYTGIYTGAESLTYTGTISGDWLFDESREAGDTAVLEDTENSRYYVVGFHGRKRNDVPGTYSVRHILITADSLELGEGEVSNDEMVLDKAEEILASWDGTEDGFAALANEHSTDDGSNTNGGLYEDVVMGEMTSNFESWCYADGRQAGDTGIVATEYGQHIMYFVGYGDVEHWYYDIETTLFNEAFTAWQNEMIEGVTAEIQSGMKSVG